MKIPSGLNDIAAYISLQAQREICTQILFALSAHSNITIKGEGNAITTFSSIHSFLTHSANISKLLWPNPGAPISVRTEIRQDLGDALGAPDLPLLKDTSFRNDLDHYDERMVTWIKDEYPKHKNGDPSRRTVSDLTIGDKNQKGGENALHLRNYNPGTHVYTYGDKDLDLDEMHRELLTLQAFLGCATVTEVSA